MKNQSLHIFLTSILLFIFLSFMIGNRPLSTPDEGRYIEIPREMVVTGDYVTPRLNGLKYFEKPPLLYWLNAGLIKVFASHTIDSQEPFDWEGLLRFWPMFFAWLGCVATILIARFLYGHKTGLLAGAILCTMLVYFALSRIIILDMVFSVFVTLALYCFLYALHFSPGANDFFKRRIALYGFSAFMGLAVLTKGIVALILAGPIIIIWLTLTKNWSKILPLYLPTCLGLFLLIVFPWHYLAAKANPDFLHKYFYVEHFLRYTTKFHSRYQPVWYFIPILLLGIFPWTPILFDKLFFGTKSANTTNINNKGHILPSSQTNLFFMIWWVWVLAFFSFSNSKLIPYILPCFAPIAVLISFHLNQINENALQSTKGFIVFFHILVAISGLYLGFIDTSIVNITDEYTIYLYIIFAIQCAYILFGVIRAKKIKTIVASTLTLGVCVILTVSYIAPIIQKPSIKEIARIIQQKSNKDSLVINYKTYYQDLPVYLNHTISVVDYLGELDFGYDAEDQAKQWMIKNHELPAVWRQDKTVFLVCPRWALNDFLGLSLDHSIVYETDRDLLITNKKI